MTWKNRRPADWDRLLEGHRTTFYWACKVKSHICTDCPHKCPVFELVNAGADAMLSARDKWWIAEMHSKCPHKKKGEKRSCNACMYIIEQSILEEK